MSIEAAPALDLRVLKLEAPFPAAMPIAPAGRLCAVVLLHGQLRPSPLAIRTGRSPLDMPIAPGRTIGDLWCMDCDEIVQASGLQGLAVHVLSNSQVAGPALYGNERIRFHVHMDRSELRGPGGVLRDLFLSGAATGEENDYVLVANAAQVPAAPLASLVAELAARGSDAAIACHADGAPCTLMLLRRHCLDCIPELGYVDLKEQALPMIAASHSVTVLQRPQPMAWSTRGLLDYVNALRRHHLAQVGINAMPGLFHDPCRPAFAVVETGAHVAPGAYLHDSVILSGGQVEAGAVVVRSVVAAGGVVMAGVPAIDQVVSPMTGPKHNEIQRRPGSRDRGLLPSTMPKFFLPERI